MQRSSLLLNKLRFRLKTKKFAEVAVSYNVPFKVQSWYPTAIGSIIPAVSNRVPGITVTECEGASVVVVLLLEVAPLDR